MRHLSAVCVFVGLAVACSTGKAPENKAVKEVRVAAASDLQNAFKEVGDAFEKKTGIKPNFNFSSSGLLAKQIEQGAPFFLFAAANKSFVDQVVKAGRCDEATAQLYSRGRLVMWSKAGAPAKIADIVDPRSEEHTSELQSLRH